MEWFAAGKVIEGAVTSKGKAATAIENKLNDATKAKIEKVRAEAQRTKYENNLANHKGGKDYINKDGKLPEGQYKEFDLNPSQKGVARGSERIVIEKNTGKTYYTPDHYETFIEIP
ncbi:hypothetical protein LJC18_03885 [Lachnospiraceae bacterium OttesenSCG-928-E19]|nr:hypothetical protein [Lachnospiraceae bacterium OttesenSCG-928-E19]